MNRSSPNGDVGELSSMVGKMLAVFRQENALELKEKWADIALRVSLPNIVTLHVCKVQGSNLLQWATSCSSHKYASHSFQVCRALQLPLSSTMFREVLTRLAESASEEKEDMQVHTEHNFHPPPFFTGIFFILVIIVDCVLPLVYYH